MTDTLKALAIFFSAICQCFAYRIIQRALQDLYPEEFGGLVESSMQTTVIVVFYVSEMLMVVGICISISKSVETATQSHKANISHYVTGERSKSDVFGGTGFLEQEQYRTASLNRLSQGGGRDTAAAEELDNPLLMAYMINGTTSNGHITQQDPTQGKFAMNDPRTYFESFAGG